jgi:hypothetical protein
MRIVSRTDDTFVVDVTNPSNEPAPFDSVGLYFVPDSAGRGEPPQRLGVVGAAKRVMPNGERLALPEAFKLAPHQTLRVVEMTAYCLDEYREGPTVKSTYHLASKRMPTALLEALAVAAQNTTRPQAAVWTTRAAMPVALLGESRAKHPTNAQEHAR